MEPGLNLGGSKNVASGGSLRIGKANLPARLALNEAIHKFGPPEIMNTDQGSRFTSFARTDRLKRGGAWISMDGKGQCIDNIFIERLWRSLKYECVYLHAWETGSQARAGIGRWITFYNHHRPHTAHGGQPPAVVYFNHIETDQQVQAVA
jgi:putative transposase